MRISRLFTLVLLAVAVMAAQENPAPQDQPTGPNQPPAGAPGWRGEHRPGIGGKITAIQGNTITLQTFDGQSATVTVTADTRFRRDRQPAKLSDFKVGDTIMVRGESKADGQWTAAAILSRTGGEGGFREGMGKRFIAGEIKSISGTSLTILRVDGETQTIQVDETTSFKKDNESVTLADFKPGDKVFGRGAVKNGVFVPEVLNLGDITQRMGHPPGGPEH